MLRRAVLEAARAGGASWRTMTPSGLAVTSTSPVMDAGKRWNHSENTNLFITEVRMCRARHTAVAVTIHAWDSCALARHAEGDIGASLRQRCTRPPSKRPPRKWRRRSCAYVTLRAVCAWVDAVELAFVSIWRCLAASRRRRDKFTPARTRRLAVSAGRDAPHAVPHTAPSLHDRDERNMFYEVRGGRQ
jgi:hypothetical protein